MVEDMLKREVNEGDFVCVADGSIRRSVSGISLCI